MKSLLKIGLLAVILFFSGCIDESSEPGNFTLKFGTECGWCAGQEFITVTSSKVEYLRNIPCGDEKGVKNQNRRLSKGEWESIVNSFNHSDFLQLELNNCNVCVDGCDEIILISDDAGSHEIRYTPGEAVKSVSELQKILMKIMEEMRLLD